MPRSSARASWSWRKTAVMVPTRTSPGQVTARPSKSFLQRTAGLLTGRIIDCRSHSTHVFLNHAQMDPGSVQVDFEWACNATTGMAKNTIRLRSEVSQKDVYRCQKVGPVR